jgi:hypothetical protein
MLVVPTALRDTEFTKPFGVGVVVGAVVKYDGVGEHVVQLP